jgi:hypothetical protein
MEYDEKASKLIPIVAKHDRNLADHLKRSGNSFLTNLAEGASDDRPLVKLAPTESQNGKGRSAPWPGRNASETATRHAYKRSA